MSFDNDKYRTLAMDMAREIALGDDSAAALGLLSGRLPALLDGEAFIVLLAGWPAGGEAGGRLGVAVQVGAGAVSGDPAGWESLAGMAVSQRILLSPGSPAWGEGLWKAGQRCVLALPLTGRDGAVGAVLAASPDPEGPHEDLTRFTEEAAGLLSALLSREGKRRRARASRAALEEELGRTRLIHEISSSVASSLVLEEVFSTTVEKMRGLVAFDRAVLALLQRGEQNLQLYIQDLRGKGGLEIAEDVPVQGSIAGRIMGMKDPYHVPDLSRVRRLSKMEKQFLDLGLVSYLAVPLTVRERPLGSFYLGSRVAGVFGRREIGILARVAPHLARAVEQARLFWEAQARMRELSALYEVGKKLIQTLDLEELMVEVLRIVKETFRFDHCAVLLVDKESRDLRVVAQHGYPEISVRSFRPSLDDPGITASVARTGKTIYVPDVRNDPRYVLGVVTGRSELALPLRIGDEVLGVLDIESPNQDAFPAATIRALNLFATQVALALDKARLFRKVQAQARTDGLTGLLNQRAFHDQLHKAAEESRAKDEPFSLILVDMDNLKEINDSLGHLAGNRAICAVAEALRRHSRGMDRTARYGGDEFALILPGAHRHQAVQAADRLRRALEAMDVEGVGRMTASCGVAVFPIDSEDETMLVVLADRAMYEAKRLGRNRVATVADLKTVE